MIRALLRLVAVAILANATWHIFTAYSAHYKFKDSVENASQSGSRQDESELRRRIIAIAGQFDVPITEKSFTLRRIGAHTIIDGRYARPIDMVPGLVYEWPFSWHVDTSAAKAP